MNPNSTDEGAEPNFNKSDLDPENDNNLNSVEFWKELGIEPIVVDANDPNYIEKVTDQVTEQIKDFITETQDENK